MTSSQAKTYSVALLLCQALLLAVIGLFNALVDPIALLLFPNEQREKIGKIDQFPHMRMTKPIMLSRTRPSSLVLGSSRSGKLPPEMAAANQGAAYNAALPGMTSFEMLRTFEHALALGELRRLTLGLDFTSFMLAEPEFRAGFNNRRLLKQEGSIPIDYHWQRLLDYGASLLTLSATNNSLTALTGASEQAREYYSDGTWSNRSSLLIGEPGYTFVGRSMRSLNSQFDVSMARSLSNLKVLLTSAYGADIDTRIIITPEHVFMLSLWQDLGRMQDWKNFHRQLILLNSQLANEASRAPYPIYGFNDLAEVVDEPIRKRAEASASWFMDGVHYHARLGSLMMQRTWEESAQQLQLATLPEYFSRVESLMLRFITEHGADYPRLMAKTETPE